jgi:hypothetical protein
MAGCTEPTSGGYYNPSPDRVERIENMVFSKNITFDLLPDRVFGPGKDQVDLGGVLFQL